MFKQEKKYAMERLSAAKAEGQVDEGVVPLQGRKVNANAPLNMFYHFGREKTLQHYLAAHLLELKAGQSLIDVASCDSPVPRIYSDLYGCEIWQQDLLYPQGLGDVLARLVGRLAPPNNARIRSGLRSVKMVVLLGGICKGEDSLCQYRLIPILQSAR